MYICIQKGKQLTKDNKMETAYFVKTYNCPVEFGAMLLETIEEATAEYNMLTKKRIREIEIVMILGESFYEVGELKGRRIFTKKLKGEYTEIQVYV